ncbi:Lachesin [Acromyrmex echinatior]|uniref:Lachesin n=1 Tax=Acromyrmex echinatior TaxID=103372 RepID=F4X2Z4_ACREC|nr:Lachesin [Acromyrmex echinatior]
MKNSGRRCATAVASNPWRKEMRRKVAWIHVGRQMLLTIHKHVVVKVPRFSVSHDNQKTWLLHINSVQQDDRGYYMCQVNTNPMISQVGFLQVVVPPNILDSLSTESTVAVREHQNITLTCKADGYPPPKLMWKREDGQVISLNKHHKDGFRIPLMPNTATVVELVRRLHGVVMI